MKEFLIKTAFAMVSTEEYEVNEFMDLDTGYKFVDWDDLYTYLHDNQDPNLGLIEGYESDDYDGYLRKVEDVDHLSWYDAVMWKKRDAKYVLSSAWEAKLITLNKELEAVGIPVVTLIARPFLCGDLGEIFRLRNEKGEETVGVLCDYWYMAKAVDNHGRRYDVIWALKYGTRVSDDYCEFDYDHCDWDKPIEIRDWCGRCVLDKVIFNGEIE